MGFDNLTIIGERINPGFRSVAALFDNDDIAGIQALAVRQAEAGAAYLNVNCGRRSLTDPDFLRRVIEAIQDVVDVPLSFDFPNAGVQELCLNVYDFDKAGGRKPIVNSIAQTRLDMFALTRICPFKVILMASERVEEGVGRSNRTAGEIHETARQLIEAAHQSTGSFEMDDFIIDVSISTMAADRDGLTRMALDGIGLIGSDPALKGVHIMGGLSNIGQQMPARAADGSPLGQKLENAFLTDAVPLGFDFLLGTPWKDYAPLGDDDYVLKTFREVIALSGMDALRATRRLYRAG
ncbi:MAG: dihydropteroate synthase [Rhodobacteraceae bacterium]|nr:dihydropteroate synthase [Paracoccaceae bacterium]